MFFSELYAKDVHICVWNTIQAQLNREPCVMPWDIVNTIDNYCVSETIGTEQDVCSMW